MTIACRRIRDNCFWMFSCHYCFVSRSTWCVFLTFFLIILLSYILFLINLRRRCRILFVMIIGYLVSHSFKLWSMLSTLPSARVFFHIPSIGSLRIPSVAKRWMAIFITAIVFFQASNNYQIKTLCCTKTHNFNSLGSSLPSLAKLS